MRILLLLLLAGCASSPVKFHTFQLAPGHTDVVWVLQGTVLHRCWLPDFRGPICVEARYFNGVPDAVKPDPPKATAPLP